MMTTKNKKRKFSFVRKKGEKAKKKVSKRRFGLFKLLNWKNISIGNKYITSFSVAAILFLLSGFIVHMQLSVVEKDIAQLDSDSQLTFEMMQMSALIQMKDMQMADYIITKNDRYVEEYE